MWANWAGNCMCRAAGMQKVFDALMKAGAAHGLSLFGTYAMNSLRMEKGYRGWGSELTAEIDMFEASMERFIRTDKPDFTGKAASLSRQQKGAANEARLHERGQHRLRLHGQRTGLSQWQGGGRDDLGWLRPCHGQIAGLRLCAAGCNGISAPNSMSWSLVKCARPASFPKASGIPTTPASGSERARETSCKSPDRHRPGAVRHGDPAAH